MNPEDNPRNEILSLELILWCYQMCRKGFVLWLKSTDWQIPGEKAHVCLISAKACINQEMVQTECAEHIKGWMCMAKIPILETNLKEIIEKLETVLTVNWLQWTQVLCFNDATSNLLTESHELRCILNSLMCLMLWNLHVCAKPWWFDSIAVCP